MFLNKNVKLLAGASSGGHWVQLQRLTLMFEKFDTCFCCTDSSVYIPKGKFFKLTDVSRDNLFLLPLCFIKCVYILLSCRPDVVVTTGALPGLVLIFCAKYFFRCKVIWIDSIANGDELSESGRIASKFADLCLTQWQDLASSRVKYMGSVI